MSVKILVITGANLNMRGIREPELYGKRDYKALVEAVETHAARRGVSVTVTQSNSEGEIVTFIQKAYGIFDGIVINAGGYTHTSVVILDALKAVGLPTVEVHLTDIHSREKFRDFSYISLYAEKFIAGKGFDGYLEAIDYLVEKLTGRR